MTTNVLRVGQNVKTTSKEPYQGILRYIGPVDGVLGTFCGIELSDATGKNDGSVKGKSYFECAPKHGVFVKKELVVVIPATKPVGKRASVAGVPATSTARTTTSIAASKRQSIAPAVRTNAARQSISHAAPVKKPAAPRPSSQIVPGESVISRSSRQSTLSTPRIPSPEKQIREDPPGDDADSARKPNGDHTVRETEQDRNNGQEEDEEDDEQPRRQEAILRSPVNAQESVVSKRASMAPPPQPEHAPFQHGSLRTSTQDSTSTAIQASREIEQLKVKLRTMEKKRMEDRDTIKQVETLKSENERMRNIIQGLSTKVKDANQEKQAAQARAQKLEQEKEAEPERPAELETMLEMATLDKEMAEEKAEALQDELDGLKAKLEEIELETEILREENKELNSTMTDEERAGAGWIHLERERDRLREALLMLRDHKSEVEADYKQEIEQLRDNLNETEEQAAKYVETAEQLQRIEDTNNHLKEQLEAAENQEEVITNMMTERDRHLAQIEDLRATLSEMEELAQTNEDLEKLYLDNEKGLLSRIDEQEAELNDSTRQVVERDQAIEDLEFTLNKFRSVMQGLQSDIDEARRTREISEAQANEMNSRSKAMMELNMRLQNNASRSATKAIELEMARAQASLSRSHVEIMSLFLPETFDADRNPIATLLTFSRLKTKAGVVATMLNERLRDRGHVISGDEVLLGHKVVQSMQWIHLSAQRFEKFMSACSPTEFASFSNAGQEIEPVERAITNWLESLKNDEMGLDSPDHMMRMQSIMADLEEKLLNQEPETKACHLLAQSQMINSNVDIAASMLDWLVRAAKAKLGDPSDEDPESIEFDRRFDQVSRGARSTKSVGGRLYAELDKKRIKHICLDETAWALFDDAEQHAKASLKDIFELAQSVNMYLNQIEGENITTYGTLVDKVAQGSDSLLYKILGHLKSLHDQVDNLLNKASDGTKGLPFEAKPAPWTIRAKEMKAQRLMSSEVQEELTQAHRRNTELASRITEKERAIEEIIIRAELAEKRVKENKSREAQDRALKDELDNLRTEKNELESDLSRSRSEYLVLLEQSSKDKDELVTLQAGNRTNGQTSTPTIAVNSELSTARIKSLLADVAILEATIRHLRWENRELTVPVSETRFAAASQAWLDPRHLKTPKWKIERDDGLDALLEVSKSLAMRPVKLKDTWRGDKWRPIKETTRWQVLRQKEELESWHAEVDDRDGHSNGFVVRVR